MYNFVLYGKNRSLILLESCNIMIIFERQDLILSLRVSNDFNIRSSERLFIRPS